MGIFYAGGQRGAFKPILAKRISVERGSLSYTQTINATSRLFGFKPQSRTERTQDAHGQAVEGVDTGSCPPESPKIEDVDESFQLACIFHGPAAVRYIRTFGLQEPEDLSGDPEACENETPYNAVRFDGTGIKAADLGEAIAGLVARPLQYFTSNKTVALTYLGVSAIGVGFGESVVTQNAADRVANIVATKAAEAEIASQLPPFLSTGVGQ